MPTSKLQSILDSTITQFNHMKQDGVLTLPEVVKVAMGVVKDIHAVKGLSIDEQKGLVFLALQRGLAAAGSLQGLSHVDPGIVAEVEKQSLHMAVSAVFGLAEAFPQVFAEIQGLLSYIRCYLSRYLPACSEAAVAASVLDPTDGALIAEAVKALKAVTSPAGAADPVAHTAPLPVSALDVRTVETTQESAAPSPQNNAVN